MLKCKGLFKVSQKSFASFRDFGSRKVYRRTIRDMDKFNRLPIYNFDTASNLFDENNGMGEYDRSEVEDFVKRDKDELLDRVDLSRRKIKFHKDILEKQIKYRQLNSGYDDTVKLTERYLNKEAGSKSQPEHPELNTNYINHSFHSIQDANTAHKQTKQEYGDYSRYFTVEKQKEPNKKSHEKRYITNINFSKRLDNLMHKYNKDTQTYKSEVEERDRRLADRLNKDLQRNDLTFDYADFIKECKNEANFKDTYLEAEVKLKNVNLNESIYDLDRYSPQAKKIIDKIEGRTFKLWENERDKQGYIHQTDGYMKRKYSEAMALFNHMEFLEDTEVMSHSRIMLSFPAQEDLYQHYLDGYTLQELSLKYGVLPTTVKKIVCEKFVYWNMIFPKIGPLRHKQLMDKAQNHRQIRFVDYGADLQKMAIREHTVPLQILKYKKLDPDKSEMAGRWFHKEYQMRKRERIPLFYTGGFSKGYLIYDEFIRRGKARKGASNILQKYLQCKDLRPGVLPDRVLRKTALGPRLALLGYSRRN